MLGFFKKKNLTDGSGSFLRTYTKLASLQLNFREQLNSLQMLEPHTCECITFLPKGSKLSAAIKTHFKELGVSLRVLKKTHLKTGSMSKHGTLAGEAYDTLEALKGTKYQAIFFLDRCIMRIIQFRKSFLIGVFLKQI